MELLQFTKPDINLTEEEILQLKGHPFIAVWREEETGRERVMISRCKDETAIYLLQLASQKLLQEVE